MNTQGLDKLLSRLPRNPGIMGKDRFFNAAVLVPLVYNYEQYWLLFEKRAAHIRQGGEISFPGGEFEPETDNNCQETAVRETMEELGIARNKIKVLSRLDTLVSPRGITLDGFLAELNIKGVEELYPDKSEVERIFILPFSWFVEHEPQVYHLQLQINPSYKDKQGEHIELLPVKGMGLPEKYSRPWSGLEHRVFIYDTPEDVIWGMTAEIIHYLVSLYRA